VSQETVQRTKGTLQPWHCLLHQRMVSWYCVAVHTRFRVGLRGSAWILISDGVETFRAAKDVRHSSEPPKLSGPMIADSSWRHRQEQNRTSRVAVGAEELQSYCESNGLVLKPQRGSVVRIARVAIVGGLAASIGAWYGGALCALIALVPIGALAWSSDFAPEALRVVFERARRSCLEWEAYDVACERSQRDKAQRDELDARRNWARFFRLQQLGAVDSMTGAEFELAIAAIYQKQGYAVTVTKASGDFGVDVIAERTGEMLAIQTKRHQSSVGVEAVQQVVSGATYYKATRAVVVTNSWFTAPAIDLAERAGVELVDRKALAKLWNAAHPEDVIPPFSLERYDERKSEIVAALRRLDGPSVEGKRKRRWGWRG
jgi:Holliday junction resolvase